MAYETIILIFSLLVLAKSSDLTVKYATRFSQKTGIHAFTVGFLIIAISTSFPELFIAIISSAENRGSLSMGNVFGSNIANMILIFGLIAFYKFRISKLDAEEIRKIVSFSIVLVAAVLLLGKTDLAVGLFLLIIFYFFIKMVYTDDGGGKNKKLSISQNAMKSFIYLIISITAVVISAKYVVDSSLLIASSMGFAASALGATIVALGTTVPELSVNLAAVRKRKFEIAIGDSIGAVMVNTTLVLGIGSILNEVRVNMAATVAGLFMIFTGILFMALSSRRTFGVREGVIMLCVYGVYLVTMVVVGFL